MLHDYGGKMRPDDEVAVAELNDAVTAFSTELLAAGTFVKDSRAVHSAKLSAEVAALLAEAKDVGVELASGRFDRVSQDATAVREELASLTKQVSDAKMRSCMWHSLLCVLLATCKLQLFG